MRKYGCSIRSDVAIPRRGFSSTLGRCFTPCPSHRVDIPGRAKPGPNGDNSHLGLPVSRFGRFCTGIRPNAPTTLQKYLCRLPIATCWGCRRLRLAANPLFAPALRRAVTGRTTQGDAVTPLPGGQELHLNGHPVVKVREMSLRGGAEAIAGVLPFATHPPLLRLRVNGSHGAC